MSSETTTMRRLSSANFRRGKPIAINVDGVPHSAYEGETIAGALLATGTKSWRHTRHAHPRGMFCGIGVCFDCLVTVNGTPNVRACVTPVAEGMVVKTQHEAEATNG